MRPPFGRKPAVAGGLAALALAACSEHAAPTGPQGTLNVDVAPLSLPGILDADYGVVVTNGADTVWSESSLSSSQYGDGAGSLTYVGTCDAGTVNHVFLTLNSLTDAGGVISSDTYVNPCPADAPCEAQAACVENEDAAITFNLAIMRDASQGFFDVAVNFQDVFCSAKVDCRDALLFDGVSRVPTAVIGFACTSGKNSAGDMETTTLFTDFQADWGAGANHLDTTSPGSKSDLAEPYAVYIDSEELPGYTKGFVNAAVAIAGGVHITGQATAATSALPTPSSGATFTSYPIVNFDVEVPASCAGWTGTVKLNAGGGVDTSYVADPSDVLYDQTSVVPPGEPAVTVPAPELSWDPNDTTSLASASATSLINTGSAGNVAGTVGTLSSTTYASTPSGVHVLSFNGTSSRISFSQYDFGPVITASAWIQPHAKSSINTLFANAYSGMTSTGFKAFWNLWNNPTKSISFEAASGGTGNGHQTAGNAVQYDSWQLLTYVIDTTGRTVQIYLNGAKVDLAVVDPSTETLGTLRPNIDMNRAWRIGGMMDGHYMNAHLGRFAIWKHALSAPEIAKYYEGTKATYPNP